MMGIILIADFPLPLPEIRLLIFDCFDEPTATTPDRADRPAISTSFLVPRRIVSPETLNVFDSKSLKPFCRIHRIGNSSDASLSILLGGERDSLTELEY